MSQTSGIGSSREDRPPAEFAFSSPSSASRLAAVAQETVLKPEGHLLSGDPFAAHTPVPAPADSRIWKRLFPGESEQAVATDADSSEVCELDHFVIEERIGAGGMGAVFRALDTRLQRVVALKVLSPSQSRDRGSVLRFQNEARAAARLDHENIARVFYVGEDRGLHFIAFEYVTGQNVRELIARTGRLAVADAVNYALQIAAALRHTAAAGVVHRDIKPSNIIITPGGRAKLVDLGLARKLATDSVGDLTVAGTTLGTFDYISPEQARDPRNVDVRSDIYSLGCTLYHMLTGGPPYSSGTVLQKLLDHQSGHAPDARAVNPQVPPRLAAICRKMMAGDAKARYSTPDELIRDLAAIAAPLGLRPMPADGYVWARPKLPASPRMRSGVIWAASLAVVVLFAIAVDGLSIPIGSDSPERVAAAAGSPKTSVGVLGSVPADSNPRLPLQDEPETSPGDLSGTADLDDGLPIGQTVQTPPLAVAAGSTGPESVVARGTASDGLATNGGRASDSIGASQRPPTSDSTDWWQIPEQARRLGSFLLSAAETPPPASAPGTSPEATTERSERLPFEAVAPFVLISLSGEHNQFDSLSAAVTAALPGDEIELHYDGLPTEGPCPPLKIRDRAITIRAGRDENGVAYRPLIEFVADSDRNLAAPPQMITVAGEGGEVRFEGVEIRMTVRGKARNAAARWALFSLADAERVHLAKSTITIANPDEWPLSVFDLRPPEGVSPGDFEISRMMNADRADGFAIEMQNCLVRGNSDLVTVAHTLPGKITFTESAFAMGATLLNVTGGVDMPIVGEEIDVAFHHVTAVLGDAVLRLELPAGRESVPFHVDARDSLFSCTNWGSLVYMEGEKSGSAFERLLTWNGRGNTFDGFSQFWMIFDQNGSAMAGATAFAEWRKKTASPSAAPFDEREVEPGSAGNVWADTRTVLEKSRSEITTRDLALNAAVVPTGILNATDGGLIGAPPHRLPTSSPRGDEATRTSATGEISSAR